MTAFEQATNTGGMVINEGITSLEWAKSTATVYAKPIIVLVGIYLIGRAFGLKIKI